jgi:hypothetical protein
MLATLRLDLRKRTDQPAAAIAAKIPAQPIFASHLPNPEAPVKKPAPHQTNRCLLTPWRILRIDFGDHR